MKIGIDIEEIKRFKKMNIELFKEKYLTENEKEYLKTKKIESLAGIFSVKESVLKAFQIGIGKIPLNAIEVLHNENGAPYINENETIKNLKETFNVKEISINISHTKQTVVSVCIIN